VRPCRRQHQLPTADMLIDDVAISHLPLVMLTCRCEHVQRTVSRCFTALRQLRRQICRSVPAATCQMLVVALVHSRLDYGNGALACIPAHLMYRLQSVLNASARLLFNLKCSGHISDARISLH